MSKNNNNGWLLISDDGFSEQNIGRPPGHLIKELVQNSWDLIDEGDHTITNRLTIETRRQHVLVTNFDDGPGIDDLNDLRTMFFTGKKDSPQNRGRFGRGFKEALCISLGASVRTRRGAIHFEIEKGKRITRRGIKTVAGTEVQMVMPWDHGVIDPTLVYFRTFLPPEKVNFYVNDELIPHRQPEHVVTCSLNTEVFENSAWVRRRRQTQTHLVRVQHDETPTLYEMGIPVCPAEWTAPYHIDVQQRVPMNPNRDAVMSGYAARLHGELIGRIFRELDSVTLKEEWEGSAAKYLSAENKRALVEKAFGNNIARSVPAMSSQQRQFDAEAQEGGAQIVNTRHLSGGFREVFQEVVPTTKQVVERVEQERRHTAASSGVPLSNFIMATPSGDVRTRRERLVEEMGGQEHINRVLLFLQTFGNNLAAEYLQEDQVLIPHVHVAELEGDVILFGPNGLTVALNSRVFWSNPTSEESIRQFMEAVANEITLRCNQNSGIVHSRITAKAISTLLQEVGTLEDHLDILAR